MIRRAVTAIAPALVLALAAPAPASAQSGYAIEFSAGRIFVPVIVNGRPAAGLLDSGAEMTILDDGFAARAGLELAGSEQARGTGAGSVEARFAKGVNLAAAGVGLSARTVTVVDLEDVASRLIGRPVDVVLGREFFDSGRLRIDLQAGRIGAVARRARPAGTRFRLTTRHGIETFPVAVEGNPPAAAHFDLGNGNEVLVGRAYAVRIGLTAPHRITGRRAGGGLGGEVQRELVTLKTLRIGTETFTDVPAAIDDSEGAGDLNIGTSILRHFLITTDFPQHALWLQRRR